MPEIEADAWLPIVVRLIDGAEVVDRACAEVIGTDAKTRARLLPH
jgi:hypothetical protein